MQNLRDKLLKAGLVTEKQVEQVATDAQKKSGRKAARGDRDIGESDRPGANGEATAQKMSAPERSREAGRAQASARAGQSPRAPDQARGQPKRRPLTAQELLEEKQRAEAFAARELEVSEQRRREAARALEAKRQSERARSLRALVTETRLHGTLGEVAFHFVRRSGKVGRLALAPALAKLLEDGGAAVVEMPGETDPAILPSDAAKRAWTIDPRAIFFWAGPQKPIGFDELPANAPEDKPLDDAATSQSESAPADRQAE